MCSQLHGWLDRIAFVRLIKAFPRDRSQNDATQKRLHTAGPSEVASIRYDHWLVNIDTVPYYQTRSTISPNVQCSRLSYVTYHISSLMAGYYRFLIIILFESISWRPSLFQYLTIFTSISDICLSISNINGFLSEWLFFNPNKICTWYN